MTERIIYQTERLLPCPLTEHEIADYGREVARLMEEMKRLGEEKKETTKHLKEKMQDCLNAANILSHKINQGAEDRMVKVRTIYFDEDDRIRTMRMDTGEIIETREPEPRERQGKLDLGEDQESGDDEDEEEDDPDLDMEPEADSNVCCASCGRLITDEEYDENNGLCDLCVMKGSEVES